jgi:hypothetical protein
LVHGDGASVQGHWGVQVVGSGLAGALLQLRLDLPDRVIEVVDQEIEECCQTAGLHLGDDLECRLTPIKFVNQFPRGHIPLLRLWMGRIRTLPLHSFVQVAPQVKKGLKDNPTAAGNGGTFRADQCEDLRGLPVEIDDTLGATLGNTMVPTAWASSEM